MDGQIYIYLYYQISVLIIIFVLILAEFRYAHIYLYLYWSKKWDLNEYALAKKNPPKYNCCCFSLKKKLKTNIFKFVFGSENCIFNALKIYRSYDYRIPQVGNKLWQCK